jgi:hypothetical protein
MNSPFDALSFFLPAVQPKLEKPNGLPDLQAFQVWLDTSRPVETLMYQNGVHWLDARKNKDGKERLLSEGRRAVCRAVYRAYERGLVELYQVRERGKSSFQYFCQKRREIKPIILCGRTDT